MRPRVGGKRTLSSRARGLRWPPRPSRPVPSPARPRARLRGSGQGSGDHAREPQRARFVLFTFFSTPILFYFPLYPQSLERQGPHGRCPEVFTE